MGTIQEPKSVKIIAGLLFIEKDIYNTVLDELVQIFGSVDAQSAKTEFTFTHYYDKEMGEGIKRQYIAFQREIDPILIRDIKIQTNEIEQKYAKSNKRTINIDPGFIALDKMVLATTKDATYRVYLGKGIYAQSTLYYKAGSYHAWEWTYPDYKDADTIAFFNMVRNTCYVTKK